MELLRRTLGVREGEGQRALLMVSYVFLLVSSLLVVKPVASSLFLSRFTAARLPIAFILVAACAAALSHTYTRLLRATPLDRLIRRGLRLNVALLVLLWVLLTQQVLVDLALYTLYVWVAVWGVAAASLFWILANVLFNVREAKRLFGLIGTGAIAGGIAGGYLATVLAGVIGSEGLLLVSAALHAACSPLVARVWALLGEDAAVERQHVKVADAVGDDGIAIVLGSRHLRLTAALVGVGVIVGKLVEFQYSAIASTIITNDDALTAFFGFWSSTANIASLLVQLAITGPLIRAIGVRSALFVLPAGLLGAASAVLLVPGLATAVALRFTDGCLKQSINKAGLELLVLPIPTAIKNRAKAVIDVLADSIATGTGGFVLLGLTLVFGSPVAPASALTIALSVLWLYLVVKVRREYLESFRERIGATGERETGILEPGTTIFDGLLAGLRADGPELPQHLKLLEEVRDPRFVAPLVNLLTHRSAAVRGAALKNISFYPGTDVSEQAGELLADDADEVRTEAMRYLFVRAGQGGVDLLNGFLAHDDGATRWPALVGAALEARTNPELRDALRLRERIEQAVGEIPKLAPAQQQRAKLACARAIGGLRLPALYGYLRIFLNESSTEVARAAIAAAASTRDPQFVPVLTRHLLRDDIESVAQEALAGYGNSAVPHLREQLESPRSELETRRRVARALGGVGTQESVAALLGSLGCADASLRFEITRALNRIRRLYPAIRIDRAEIDARVHDESRGYLETLSLLYAQRAGAASGLIDAPEESLPQLDVARRELIAALEHKLDRYLERIFRLLGLRFPPDDIRQAYLGLQSGNAEDLRANALEFLDNLLDPGLKRIIIPLIESSLPDAMIEDILERFDLRVPDSRRCLARLLGDEDAALQVAALRIIGLTRDARLVAEVGELIDHPSEEVRSDAAHALQQIGVLGRPE